MLDHIFLPSELITSIKISLLSGFFLTIKEKRFNFLIHVMKKTEKIIHQIILLSNISNGRFYDCVCCCCQLYENLSNPLFGVEKKLIKADSR